MREGPLALGCRPPEQGAPAWVPHHSDDLGYATKADLMWDFDTCCHIFSNTHIHTHASTQLYIEIET